MKINGMEVTGEHFAYDGGHKIYVIEREEEKELAMEKGYDVYPIKDIESAYEDSNSLRFINSWSLDKTYAPQYEDARFEP